MCGIAGYWAGKGQAAAVLESHIGRMCAALVSRGPDYAGRWIDGEVGVALGHRRLAIIDLSAAGHQPMLSADGRYVIVFNGEIYNHLALRRALGECNWRGHSDTETLLAAIAAWGLEATLPKLAGMFAFALWDRVERTLVLARDRIGEKPLYYGRHGGSLMFASELKAFCALPSWNVGVTGSERIDKEALALFLRYGYVPAPRTIYQGIGKLPPGTFLKMTGHACQNVPQAWWRLDDVALAGTNAKQGIDERQAIDAVEHVLKDAVGRQMAADVPLGALLSGGIDSSIVVALMQAQSQQPIRTFSIGFTESAYDEAAHAKQVARHLGTSHTELYVSPNDARSVIPQLPDIYDEPFGDSSQIPTALVCAMARRQVTVCLSGDAGDELFGGYNRYLWADALWQRIGHAPMAIRRLMARGLQAVSAKGWNALFRYLDPLLPQRVRVSHPGDKLHKLAAVLGAPSPEAFYQLLVSQWRGVLPLRGGIVEPATRIGTPELWPALAQFPEQMMALDAQTYLPDDILVKVDRAAMAHSLEVRVPFLDPEVIEFAWQLPLNMKIRDGQGKWLLRKLLDRYIPQTLIDRPKQGFGVPIEDWLRGPLREWAEDLLSPVSLAADGLLDPTAIRALWQTHLKGINRQHALWNVLMFQAWRRRWL